MFGGIYIIVLLCVPANVKSTGEGSLLDSCKFTPFVLCVKTKLLHLGSSQKWLEEEVSARSGLYVDSGYIYKIFAVLLSDH